MTVFAGMQGPAVGARAEMSTVLVELRMVLAEGLNYCHWHGLSEDGQELWYRVGALVQELEGLLTAGEGTT
jgi:hypothetical protein